jgi:hypothetical protein
MGYNSESTINFLKINHDPNKKFEFKLSKIFFGKKKDEEQPEVVKVKEETIET